MQEKPQKDLFAAMILNWLIPGLGHWYVGEKIRGAIFFVTITLTYWTGILIGGALSTVNIKTNTAWFFGQVWAGGYTILAAIIAILPGAEASYSKTLDLSTIYTGTAGLLNVFIILDVLTRQPSQQIPEIKK